MKAETLSLTKRTIWRLTEFSVLLICQTLMIVPATEGSVYNEERSQRGIVLLNHTYKSLYTENYPSCLMTCIHDSQCKSFNYWWYISRCDLNNKTRYSAEEKFLKLDISCTYMGLRREPEQKVQNATLKACKFDFEDGIYGWEKTGTAFDNQPTYGDNPTFRNRGTANQQGDWWIGGYEDRPNKTATPGGTQGDGPQGTLTSPSFNIRGNSISFLIGGGCFGSFTRAELVVNSQVVRNETGHCNETMTRMTWDVSSFIGKRARVRLVDNSSEWWNHINFDDLRGDISCEQN